MGVENQIHDAYTRANELRSDLGLLRGLGIIMGVPTVYIGMEIGYAIAKASEVNPLHGALAGLVTGVVFSISATNDMCDEISKELYRVERTIEWYKRH